MNQSNVGNLIIPETSGKYGLGLAAQDFDLTKPRYLRITDIDDDGNLLYDDMKSVDADDVEKYILKENDLVVARTGNSTGRIYVHSSDNGRLAYAGFLIKYEFDANKINPRYMKYYALSDVYKSQVSKYNGSTRGNMSAQDFMDIQVIYPDRIHQDKLVEICDLIDKKIKLNKSICADLEAMAKQIYDYWFVQFEFPDENGKPYKSSGGKMVWCEELNREIPEGWFSTSIKDISKRVKVGFVGTIDKYYCSKETGVPIIRPAEMSKQGIDYKALKHVTEEFYLKNKKSQVHKGDILISRCGKDGIPNIYTLDNPAQVLNAVIIEPDDVIASSIYINEFLKSEYAQIQISYGTSGSVQGVINTELIAQIKMSFDKNVVKRYTEIMTDLYTLIHKTVSENIQLTSLRDFLLPMLMNGQIKIGE